MGIRTFTARIRQCSEHGSLSIEAVILTPVVALLILFAIACGRYGLALQSVQNAANAAARDASLARDTSTATSQAKEGAASAMTLQNTNCASLGISIDSSGINAPLGTIGTVDATVSCTISLSDIAFPGIPGSIHIQKTATSPVDPYRERS